MATDEFAFGHLAGLMCLVVYLFRERAGRDGCWARGVSLMKDRQVTADSGGCIAGFLVLFLLLLLSFATG